MSISNELKKDLYKTISFDEGKYYTVDEDTLNKYFSSKELEYRDQRYPVIVVDKDNPETWSYLKFGEEEVELLNQLSLKTVLKNK